MYKWLNAFYVHKVLWWDIRNMAKPTERMVLDLSKEGNLDKAIGAVSLEFEATMVSHSKAS